MTKEIQELSRSIYFSAFSVAMMSITFAIVTISLALTIITALLYETPEEWKDRYFKNNPDADTNGDGKLNWTEQKAHEKAHS